MMDYPGRRPYQAFITVNADISAPSRQRRLFSLLHDAGSWDDGHYLAAGHCVFINQGDV